MPEDNNKKKIKIAREKTLGDFDIKMREIEIKEKEQAAKEKAKASGLPYINLAKFPISQDALKLIDKAEAKKHQIVCFFYGDRQVRLGAVNPLDEQVKKFVKKIKDQFFNKDIGIYLCSLYSFDAAFAGYANLPALKETSVGVEITEQDLKKFANIKNFQEIESYIRTVPLTDIVNLLLSSAINVNASDIHIEAEEGGVKVRFRLDGILHDVTELPKEKWKILVSRVKLVSSLKIIVDSVPQDGSFTIYLDNDRVDVIVSTLPTAYGESVVIRLLLFSRENLSLEDLGLDKESYSILEKGISRPNGMILNTGPTGSGKTTTLYSILNSLNKEGTKIITIEDPIEYHLEGVNQSHVDASRGYTFAKALRSVVRQDPDIVMVGEIRDADTVDTAIQASLTGHLVLSTVHTNSAAGAVPRLLSMQAQSFLLAPALNTVIGQRLVRKICKECKEEIRLDEKTIAYIKEMFSVISEKIKEKIDINNLAEQKFYMGKGCEKCGNIGYKGRLAIFEIINFDEEIREAIISDKNISEDKIKKIAIQKGMTTMAQDGILKALRGITSVEEVLRVTG